MTREEALHELGYISRHTNGHLETYINRLYDDFESRICENCKLQYDKDCPIAELNNPIKYCSEWESKDE